MEAQSHFSTVKTGMGFAALLLSIGGIAALATGLMEGLPVAYTVLGGLVFLIVAGLGAVAVLFIQWLDEAKDARHARREQERFTANQAENLQIMALTAKAQAAQGLVLNRQVQAARILPGPAGVPDMIDFDSSLFIEGDTE